VLKSRRIVCSFQAELEVLEDRHEPLYRKLVQSLGNLGKAEAAKLIGVCEGRFSKTFKQLAGMTYPQAKTRVKMEIACVLFSETSTSILRVAEILRYSERSNFDRVFTRVIGVRAARFRRKHQFLT